MGSNLTADIIGGRQGLVLLQAAVKAIEQAAVGEGYVGKADGGEVIFFWRLGPGGWDATREILSCRINSFKTTGLQNLKIVGLVYPNTPHRWSTFVDRRLHFLKKSFF